MTKIIILSLIKALSIINNWYFIELLVDSYCSDVEYIETIIRNIITLQKYYLLILITKQH